MWLHKCFFRALHMHIKIDHIAIGPKMRKHAQNM